MRIGERSGGGAICEIDRRSRPYEKKPAAGMIVTIKERGARFDNQGRPRAPGSTVCTRSRRILFDPGSLFDFERRIALLYFAGRMSEISQSASQAGIEERLRAAVAGIEAYDIHTHLYDPAFGELLLWGIDDLLTYHYLVAEAFRYFDFPYEKFWSLSKSEQADLIWDVLFLKHSPVSEACRGVLTTMNGLGLDVAGRDLTEIRRWTAEQSPAGYVTRCMEVAKVRKICMTNSPFDDLERPVWEKGFERDSRFTAALRIDPMLLDWENTHKQMAGWGYNVSANLDESTIAEVRRFLADWSGKMDAQFAMVSLPPTFAYPDDSVCGQLIEKAVLPHCREHGLPFALMPGVKRGVNPQLQLAGDGLAKFDISNYERLFAAHPENKFAVTALSRENQHELCVAARKFRNLHVFGCWWFTNVPHVINEMTRMRLELIGLSMTPQHSDARVMDQVIYKWSHSREIITGALIDKYSDLEKTGWVVSDEELARDVNDLFGGAFEAFCAR